MEYESTAHARYLLLSHLIFVCKDRKKLLVVYGEETKQIFEEIAATSDFSFEA
jgi:putative transposase